VSNRVTREIETIEIPPELSERSRLGIMQAKRELTAARLRGVRKWGKYAAVTAGGMLIAAALGAAASPAFASYVKSLFWSDNVDAGLKKAAVDGFAKPVNMQVTDQGITLKVKEIVNDVFRFSILYGVEKDGKPLDSDLLFESFIPSGPDQDPYANNYTVTDTDGNELRIGIQSRKVGTDRIMFLEPDDLVPGKELQSLSELPDTVHVRFDIHQIGKVQGKWRLDVPIDVASAKSSASIVPLYRKYDSPLGFSVNFIQLRHGPSKSEMLLQVNETQAWRSSGKGEPSFSYRIMDGQGRVVAAYDSNTVAELAIENKNVIPSMIIGRGQTGRIRYWHSFFPFQDSKDLKLELTAVYTKETLPNPVDIPLDPQSLKSRPLVKTIGDKTLTFSARPKTEQAPIKLADDREAFQGKGWIVEANQQLGTDMLDLQWQLKDNNGKQIQAQSAIELTKNDHGEYRNRTLFFFPGEDNGPEGLNLTAESYIQKHPVSWSIPLVPSNAPAPLAADEPRVYDLTVADLQPEVVNKAEQAMKELLPGRPVELYGVTDLNDRWFIHLKDDSGIVIVDKAKGKPFIVERTLPYDQVEAKLQYTAEQAIRELAPGQTPLLKKATRKIMNDEDRWIFVGEKTEVDIDAKTGSVVEASMDYDPKQIDPIARAEAERAYNIFSGGKELKISELKLMKTPQQYVWEIYSNHSLFAKIGAKTKQLLYAGLSYKNDEPGDKNAARALYSKPFYTEARAIAAAAPVVKKLFGIELDGYTVNIHLNAYTFAKKGSPTVQAKINAKGTFWEFNVIPERGFQD